MNRRASVVGLMVPVLAACTSSTRTAAVSHPGPASSTTVSPRAASSPSPSDSASPSAQPASDASAAAEAVPACPTPPPQAAYAALYASSGQLQWRVRLVRAEVSSPVAPAPVVVGDTAYVAHDATVWALRVKDGKSRWSHQDDGTVTGLWSEPGRIAVLLQAPAGAAAGAGKLIGLDAATGDVKWTVPVPGNAVYGGPAGPTTDGGLAWVGQDGRLRVVDLATGRVRWTVRKPRTVAMAAAGNLVLWATSDGLHAYNSMTGRPVWTVHAIPQPPGLRVVGDLALVAAFGGPSTVLTAVDVTTGRVAFTLDKHVPLRVAGGSGSDVRLVELQARLLVFLVRSNGSTRWQTDADVEPDATMLTVGGQLIDAEYDATGPDAALISRSASTGRVAWRQPVHMPTGWPVSPLYRAGTVFLSWQNAGAAHLGAFRASNGKPLWTVKVGATPYTAPAVLAAGSILTVTGPPQLACPD